MSDPTIYEIIRESYTEIPLYVKAGLASIIACGGLASRVVHEWKETSKNYEREIDDMMNLDR